MNLKKKQFKIQDLTKKEANIKINNIQLNQTLPNSIAINNFHLNTSMVNFNTNEISIKHNNSKKPSQDKYYSNTPQKLKVKIKTKDLSDEQKKDMEKSRINRHLIDSLRQQLNEISTLHPTKISHHISSIHSKSKDSIPKWNSLLKKEITEEKHRNIDPINCFFSQQSFPPKKVSIHSKSKDNLLINNSLFDKKKKEHDYDYNTESIIAYLPKKYIKKSHHSSLKLLLPKQLMKTQDDDKNNHSEISRLNKTMNILQDVIIMQNKYIEKLGHLYTVEMNDFKKKTFTLINNMTKTNMKLKDAYNTMYQQVKEYFIDFKENKTTQKLLYQVLKENDYLRRLTFPSDIKVSNVIQNLQLLHTKHNDTSPKSINIESQTLFDGTMKYTGNFSNSDIYLQNKSYNIGIQIKAPVQRILPYYTKRNTLCYLKMKK